MRRDFKIMGIYMLSLIQQVNSLRFIHGDDQNNHDTSLLNSKTQDRLSLQCLLYFLLQKS
jgi:hypothetical protein